MEHEEFHSLLFSHSCEIQLNSPLDENHHFHAYRLEYFLHRIHYLETAQGHNHQRKAPVLVPGTGMIHRLPKNCLQPSVNLHLMCHERRNLYTVWCVFKDFRNKVQDAYWPFLVISYASR